MTSWNTIFHAVEVRVLHSIRRPTVFKVLLSNGRTRSYLHKAGERLQVDAAAQVVLKHAASVWDCSITNYSVTPLCEDSGLIEFLEDHVEIRTLLAPYKLDNVLDAYENHVARPVDENLILSPTQSLELYKQMCAKVPPYAFRSAIETNSSCIQDFILKKNRFTESIAANTILTWILGLGDRHLDNLMLSTRDGAICNIDWGNILQYGHGELPPARLTRCFVAVCDHTVLESRLQKLLGSLQDNRKMFTPVVTICFKWMNEQFSQKLTYINDILEGNALSCDITRKVLEVSTKLKHKEKLLQHFDAIFCDYRERDCRSVQTQISCLLRQCTDVKILSITRARWEPWI